jgi:hypothetical protein
MTHTLAPYSRPLYLYLFYWLRRSNNSILNSTKLKIKIVYFVCFSFPDVMMPSYAVTRWSCVFFITYLSMVLYFLMNLVSITKSYYCIETFNSVQFLSCLRLFTHRFRVWRKISFNNYCCTGEKRPSMPSVYYLAVIIDSVLPCNISAVSCDMSTRPEVNFISNLK